MRTTLDLDEDILRVAKHLAQERAQSLGRVLSDLARQGLQPRTNPKVRRPVALARNLRRFRQPHTITCLNGQFLATRSCRKPGYSDA